LEGEPGKHARGVKTKREMIQGPIEILRDKRQDPRRTKEGGPKKANLPGGGFVSRVTRGGKNLVRRTS